MCNWERAQTKKTKNKYFDQHVKNSRDNRIFFFFPVGELQLEQCGLWTIRWGVSLCEAGEINRSYNESMVIYVKDFIEDKESLIKVLQILRFLNDKNDFGDWTRAGKTRGRDTNWENNNNPKEGGGLNQSSASGD